MKRVSVAIIGFGKIARDQHVPSISANAGFELVATSSRSGEGVARRFTGWRELIRTIEGLDAVAITTPPGPRYEIARECLLAGLHCLLEKPPTAGLAELADLDRLARSRKLSLFTTWHAQYHSTVDAAAQCLLGKKIRSMDICWHEDVYKWHPGQQWIWKAGGFGVLDPGINALSIAAKIFPGSLFVQSAELKIPQNAQTPIAADIIFSSPEAGGLLHASLDWRRSEGEEWTITIETDDGMMVRLEDGGAKLIVNDGEPVLDNGPGEYYAIYRTFLDLIDQKQSLVDVAPFRLVADCLMNASRTAVEPVHP